MVVEVKENSLVPCVVPTGPFSVSNMPWLIKHRAVVVKFFFHNGEWHIERSGFYAHAWPRSTRSSPQPKNN